MTTYVRVRVKESGDHIDVPEERLDGFDFDELYEVLPDYPRSNYSRRPAFKVDLTKSGKEPEVFIGGTVGEDDVDLVVGDNTSGESGTKKEGK